MDFGKLIHTALFLIAFCLYFVLMLFFGHTFYKYFCGDIALAFPVFSMTSIIMLGILTIICAAATKPNMISCADTMTYILLIMFLLCVVLEQFLIIGVSIHDFMDHSMAFGKFMSYLVSYIANPLIYVAVVNIVKGVMSNAKY